MICRPHRAAVMLVASLPLAAPLAPAAAAQHGRWCLTPEPDPELEGLYSPNLWAGGVVPYRFADAPGAGFVSLTPEQRQLMRAAMDEIESVCGVVFTPWAGEANHLVIRGINDPGSASWVQCIGNCGGPQNVTISIDHWDLHGVLLHELGHTVGLYHEQHREDRDEYFEILPCSASYYPLLPAPGFPAHPHGRYDLASIMHYDDSGPCGPTWDRGFTIVPKYRRQWQHRVGTAMQLGARLSNGDVLVLQHLYGGDPPPAAFELAAPAAGAAVGAGWAPRFSWAPSEAAASFRLQVAPTPVFETPVIDVALPGAQTEYAHPTPLEDGRLYWWRVTASNAIGEVEAYPLASQTFYTAAAYPGRLYVDASAPAGGDGGSWASPLRDLAVATEIAHASDGATREIRVAGGIYTPDFGTGDRTLSFWLADGCALLGGYAGFGAASPDERNPGLHETVLSGDLNGDDEPGFVNIADNTRNIVISLMNPETTVLDGVTIRGANADSFSASPYFGYGGGALVSGGAPILREVRFVANHADGGGGGLALDRSRAAPTIERCAFIGNRAGPPGFSFIEYWYGGGGGAFYGYTTGINFPVIDCSFRGNSAVAGGAFFGDAARPRFINCLFDGNAALALSGRFVGGGAIHTFNVSRPEVINCTISGNTSPAPGGAIRSLASSVVVNSILWDNSPDEVAGTAAITYSNIRGGWAGAGNINADPLFADPIGGDFGISAGSPCIDAASNASVPPEILTDLAGLPRFVDDPATPDTGVPGGAGGDRIVDMGAYEFQGCYADCDASGSLDFFDFLCFQNLFAAEDPAADCDGSMALDFFDFLCFQNAFAAGCP